MFLWTLWIARSSAPSSPSQPDTVQTSSSFPRDTVSSAPALDSATRAARFGIYAQFTQGRDSIFFVETRSMRLGFGTRGARLYNQNLKGFTTSSQKPIQLWDSLQQYQFIFAEGRSIVSSKELFFSLVHAPGPLIERGEDSVVFRLELAKDTFIQVSYHIPADGYHLDWKVDFRGLRERLRNPYILCTIQYQTPQTEPSSELMQPHCMLYYRQGEDIEALTPDEEETEQKVLQGRIQWVSAKGQFFCFILQAKSAFSGATLTSLPYTTLPRYQLQLQLPLEGEKAQQRWYLGPTRYTLLKSYGESYEKQLNLGWSFIRYINTLFIIPLFNFMEKYIPSYGIIITILALVVKIILSPLTWRSYMIGVRMQIVNELPEVKALEEKYKDQPDKLMVERTLLYRQLGVNPLSGCIPLLLQIPIFFAMTSFFPNAFELRQQGFLWTRDLSSYDNLISWGIDLPLIGDHLSLFALLTALSTLAFTYFTQQSQTSLDPRLRWLPYLTPVIFFIFLNDYSSALSWYYFVLNVLTIAQTLIMKRFVDRESLIRKLREAQKRKQVKVQMKEERARMRRWLKR